MSIDADRLLAWYRACARDLPWRRTAQPYAVWVSEIMLQQTQVATVLPYYDCWMARFPTVESLAAAEEDEALAVWQGLGYYRRCRSLLDGARRIVANGWPVSSRAWRMIPGVGAYTANAIASISLGERVPVVDGNVERVFARVAGCEDSGRTLHRRAWEWAESAMPDPWTPDWNQALMELGATVCTPQRPDCDRCPWSEGCFARIHGRQALLPVPSPRLTLVPVALRVVVPWTGERFGLHRPPESRWWKGLWQFPTLEEVGGEVDPFSELPAEKADLGTFRHAVTRHRLSVQACLARVTSELGTLTWFGAEELASVPLPALHRRIAVRAVQKLLDGATNQ